MLLTKVMNTADRPAVIHRDIILFLAKYEGGSKSFRPDIQKPRQMENAARDIWGHLRGLEL